MRHVKNDFPAGTEVALVGGGSLRALAARDLNDGRRTSHPELVLFPSWGTVQDCAPADDLSGCGLQPLVGLVGTHGTDGVLNVVSGLTTEQHAPVTRLRCPQSQGP